VTAISKLAIDDHEGMLEVSALQSFSVLIVFQYFSGYVIPKRNCVDYHVLIVLYDYLLEQERPMLYQVLEYTFFPRFTQFSAWHSNNSSFGGGFF